jgi:hypothetical protein
MVFEQFTPGAQLRGRFVGVQFRRGPNPPGATCTIQDAEFVADEGLGIRDR